MGQSIRAKDWSTTPLGPLDAWPPALRTVVFTALSSRFPMCLYWGEDRLQIYNDGFRAILGNKHPAALGGRAEDTWGEIWPAIGPLFRSVWQTGAPHWGEDFVLYMERRGYLEETAFTFSYSALRDEGGHIFGLLNTAIETTGRLLTERRMRSLRHLAYAAAKVHTLDEAYKVIPEALEYANPDVPFSLHYEVLPRAEVALLKGTSGFPGGMSAAGFPSAVSLLESDKDGDFALTLRKALRSDEREQTEDHHDTWQVPKSSAGIKATRAQVWPVFHSGEGHVSLLVVGLNPHHALDADYLAFIDLVADHVGTALRNATAFEAETKRAVALAELNRSKTEFFSNVSHEFRTPLTLILGPLEELLSSRRGPINTDQRHELELLKRNSLRLLKLVNTLLDFSKVESGGAKARLEPTDLSQLTRDLASVFGSAFQKAGLELKTQFPDDLRPVRVDAEMWEKIVLNLLSNALKFTRVGKVTLALTEEKDSAVLRVSDTGMGIPPHEVPHVFDRFHRVKGQDGRSFVGSGIGLALVKDLVHLMSGTVEVVSERDVGTTFTVRLPLGQSGESRVMAPVEGSTTAASIVQEAEGWLSNPLPQAAQAERPPGWYERERILWVDDSADMRDYVTRLLSGRWDVVLAPDGHSALRLAQEDPPALILADRMMPGLDGLELIKELRRNERTRTIPVILLSAREREDLPVEELEADPDDYIFKPFKASELIARINAHLRLAKLRRDSDEALRKSQEQFLNAQKMEAIGRLAGGVAHDFNNMLTAINGYGDLIFSQTPEDSPVHEYAQEIRKAGERAAALTSQLLAYSRRQLLVPRVLDPREVLEEMSNWMRKLVPENVRITQRFVEPGGHVKLDRSQFEQIVLNLVVNARDAMPGGGRMELSAEIADWPQAQATLEGTWLAPAPGKYVRLSVQDTGFGMGPEITAHLFEPFFTTKEVGRGSGLGLSAVYGIVKQAGGAISLQTEPRKGSRFSVYLPLVEPEAPALPSQPRTIEARPAGKGTILLVEDEEVVRRLAKTVLQKAGYEVIEAARPEEAVRIHDGFTRPIDLLLTDMIMPGMNGRELALHLSAMRPGMEVLIMSGYTDDQLLRSGISANSTAFLAKPFDPRRLLDKVAEVLRTRAAGEK